MVNLVEIDLSKAKGHKHPDIKTDGSQYLVKVNSHWYAGNFTQQWYGLCFFSLYGSHMQFDAPTELYSGWKKVYKIVEVTDEPKPTARKTSSAKRTRKV